MTVEEGLEVQFPNEPVPGPAPLAARAAQQGQGQI